MFADPRRWLFYRVRVMSVRDVDVEEDVPPFFEVDEVCQCSLLILSSLIQYRRPPPGIIALLSSFILQTVGTLCATTVGWTFPPTQTRGGLKNCQRPKLWVPSTLKFPAIPSRVSPLAYKNFETSNFDNRDKLTGRQAESLLPCYSLQQGRSAPPP